MNMTGNTILITGAGSGIGLALAEEFARMDNQVIVAARSPEKLKAAGQRGSQPSWLMCPILPAFRRWRQR